MSSRPTPHRRGDVPSAEEFALQADTLTAAVPVTPPAKARKVRSYTFRMTEETHARLREVAEREDRSIQWVFDRILLPALESHED